MNPAASLPFPANDRAVPHAQADATSTIGWSHATWIVLAIVVIAVILF